MEFDGKWKKFGSNWYVEVNFKPKGAWNDWDCDIAPSKGDTVRIVTRKGVEQYRTISAVLEVLGTKKYALCAVIDRPVPRPYQGDAVDMAYEDQCAAMCGQ